MPLLHASVTKFSADLARPFQNANHKWRQRSGLLLRVLGGDGREGLGEASPLPNYSPDTIADCHHYCNALELFDEGELSLARIEECIGQVPISLPAARFALETALLDLLAQQKGQSISELIGGVGTTAECSGLIDPHDALASLRSLQKRGVHSGKLKIGMNWVEELATIVSLRKECPDFRLRLDVNGAWSPQEARENLASLASLSIDFVEQPLLPDAMSQLVESAVPIAADESMQSELGRESLAALLPGTALVALVLKPTVLGGMLACMRHREWGARHGVTSVASHCFEGPVGTAAVAELAIAMPSPFAAGVDRHEALTLWPDVHIPQFQGGSLHRHQGGLGVTLPAKSKAESEV